jgi:putative ABC transport system permease protein
MNDSKTQNLLPIDMLILKDTIKDAFDILPITLKEGRLPEDEGEILLEYWVSDYMPSNPKIGDIITLPIGIRLDEAGNELSPNSYMKHEIFQEEDIRKYTIVGFLNQNLHG